MHDYLIEKRLEVLEAIRPICEAFGITDYDYEVNTETGSEYLRIEVTKIGCACNSMWAIKQELVGWIFLNVWKDRTLGAFDKQTRKHIRQYWNNHDEVKRQ